MGHANLNVAIPLCTRPQASAPLCTDGSPLGFGGRSRPSGSRRPAEGGMKKARERHAETVRGK